MVEMVAVGDEIAGKYRVEKELGSGSMGVVVAARHVRLDVLVALKVMTAEAFRDAGLVSRFVREARAAARLRGEHVARVTDVGTLESGAPYFVMEYLEGSDLSELLWSEGRLPVPRAVEYVLQACEALDEAHAAGIVHRDIKPSNLFLTKRPNGTSCIKVLDFGISKSDRFGSSSAKLHATHARAILGSPYYMAPEQMRAAHDVDGRADIWALGATLYELLTGAVPFEADSLLDLALQVAQKDPRSLRDMRPEIPWALEQVVITCLEKDRHDRFSSARKLASALAPFAQRWKSALRDVVPRAVWSNDTAVTSADATAVDAPEDTAVESTKLTIPLGDRPPQERRAAMDLLPPPPEPGLGPRATLGRPLYDAHRLSERVTPTPAAEVALAMRVAVPGSVPPVSKSAPPPGLRTGARLSWGRSQKFQRLGPRIARGMAAVGVLGTCGAAVFIVNRSREPHGAPLAFAPVSGAITASLAPLTGSHAAAEPSAAGLQPSPAPAQSAEPSARIPTLSVTDLPKSPSAGFTPPVPRPAPAPEPFFMTAAAAPATPNCGESYYLDENGIKKFRFECIESPSDSSSIAAKPPAPPRTAASTPTGSPIWPGDPSANPHDAGDEPLFRAKLPIDRADPFANPP